MSRLKLLSLFALVLVCGLTIADAMDDKNIEELKRRIIDLFGDGQEDLFSRALRMLVDYEASNEQIEAIVGNHFSKVHKMWEEVRTFASLLVISPMKNFQRPYLEVNPSAVRVFQDFYDMILADLDPETVGINRDLYITYEIVDEESFTEVYTRLVDLYQRYIPLRDYMEKEKDEMMDRIKRLSIQKNPDYKPSTIDPFPNTVSASVEPTNQMPEIATPSPPPSPKDRFSAPKGKAILAYENVKTNEIVVLTNLGTSHSSIFRGMIGVILMLLMV